jgi:protein LSM14
MSSASIPYAGSKISLISKSDIRYVGTLHSINQQDSTVSLEQVRSYGTEGRKKNKSEEISGTDQIYEYIVFRGSDIKDLQVCEAPQRSQVQVPKDPAILGTTAPSASTIPPGFSMMQGLVDGGNMLQPNLQLQLNGINPYMLQLYQQQLWQQQLQQQQQPAASLLKTNEQAPDQNNIIAGMEKLNLANDTNAKAKDEATSQPAKAVAEKTESNNQQNDKNNNRSQNNSNNYNRNYNNNRFQRSNRQNNYRRGVNQRGRRNWNNSKHISLPDSDFDFESANAKFKELSNKEADKNEKKEQAEDGNSQNGDAQEENGTEEKTQENFYNKSSSFFDNISCESKDRAEEQGKKFDRRAKQYEERKLNMETFGQATVNRGGHRGYRRNNYHTYRGRNYNRNNGGYHRNNYRNYYNNNNNRQKNQDQQANQNNSTQQQKQESNQ